MSNEQRSACTTNISACRRARTHHRTNLGQEVVLADEPEVLRVAFLGGLDLRDDAGRVVGSELEATGTAGTGPGIVRRREERDGLEAS